MAKTRNILVINDEAHHAWRVNTPAAGQHRRASSDKDSVKEATIWVGGLDRIQQQNGILRCFDLSATPFSPSGGRSADEALFPWIVSDFGLNDAIESGLVKTPRVVVRDDSIATPELKSRLYHIYNDAEVKDNINRRAEATETVQETSPPLLHVENPCGFVCFTGFLLPAYAGICFAGMTNVGFLHSLNRAAA